MNNYYGKNLGIHNTLVVSGLNTKLHMLGIKKLILPKELLDMIYDDLGENPKSHEIDKWLDEKMETLEKRKIDLSVP